MLNFVLYVILLIGRGWGAHRTLNYEERIAVGSALSQSLFLSLNDWSYGILFPRILISLTAQFPLEHLPILLLSIATLLWAIYSLIIFWAVYRATGRYVVAMCASLVLILVPLPGLGMQGVVWNSFWPMFIALAVLVAVCNYGGSKFATIAIAIYEFLTAASNPVSAVLLVLVGFDYLRNSKERNKILVVGAGLFMGLLFSLFIQIRQEPPMRYLGEWTQEMAQTSQTFGWIEESGANRIRSAPPIDIITTIRSVPGSVKYLLTQMSPEPLASEWILSEASSSNLSHLLILSSIFFGLPLCRLFQIMRKKRDFRTPKTVLRISLIIVITFVLQIILIGEVVQTNQFLFVPVCCYWIAVAFLIPKLLNQALDSQNLVAVGMLALILVFSLLVKQNFRDSFDTKLPQIVCVQLKVNPEVGCGRYETNPSWQNALKNAREKCKTNLPNDLIIITQKTLDARKDFWFDASMVVRCKFIVKT